MAAIRRLNKELKNFQTAAPGGAAVELEGDNLYKWLISVPGPTGSAYEGGIFKIELEYPASYPLKAPEAHIKTKMFHPRVDKNDNHYCFQLLNDWAAATPTTAVIEDFIESLRNPQDCPYPLDPEAFTLAKEKPRTFAAEVRKYVDQYAK